MPTNDESIDSILKRMKPVAPPAGAEGVPGPEEVDIGPCASRVTVKWWPGFHVKRAKLIPNNTLTTRSFDYSHIGYRECDPGNTWFVFEVNEPEKWRIRVEGRALWRLYNYLHQHRLEWIEPVSGNAEMGIVDGTPVILRITIRAFHVCVFRV